MKSFRKKPIVFNIALLAALAMITFSACDKTEKAGAETDNKLKVTATFNALAEMCRAVGGDYADVSTIIPDGMEPHDFELKAQDMENLSRADVFVYNGFGLELWVPKAIESSGNAKLIAVDSSTGANPIELKEESRGDTVGVRGGRKGREGVDPHLWLSPKGAQIQARNIANAFAKADGVHAEEYAKNADSFIAELEALYEEYSAKIGSVPHKTIVTGHAAFGYLCRDFGLEQNSVEDEFADGEPSPQQLASLVEFAREKNVKTIFAEKMASPAVSQTLAAEIGAKVVTIYTMENTEDNKSYLERMRDNLEVIVGSDPK